MENNIESKDNLIIYGQKMSTKKETTAALRIVVEVVVIVIDTNYQSEAIIFFYIVKIEVPTFNIVKKCVDYLVVI